MSTLTKSDWLNGRCSGSQRRILDALKQNRVEWYSKKDIADITGLSYSTVKHGLCELRKHPEVMRKQDPDSPLGYVYRYTPDGGIKN